MIEQQTVYGDFDFLPVLDGAWSPDGYPHIKYYFNLAQHTDEWERARKGIITASVMKHLISKKTDKKTGEVTYSVPDTEKTKAYLFQLAAERLYPDLGDNFQSYAMQRGVIDEIDAFNLYSEKYGQLRSCGFVTNSEHGVLLGYSPDGLTALNDEGQIEAKSRDPKFQVETIYYDQIPDEYQIQVQTGLIVTKRKWCDFISYCGGAVMYKTRVEPDPFVQMEIIKAAQIAEKKVQHIVLKVRETIAEKQFYPTKKRLEDIIA